MNTVLESSPDNLVRSSIVLCCSISLLYSQCIACCPYCCVFQFCNRCNWNRGLHCDDPFHIERKQKIHECLLPFCPKDSALRKFDLRLHISFRYNLCTAFVSLRWNMCLADIECNSLVPIRIETYRVCKANRTSFHCLFEIHQLGTAHIWLNQWMHRIDQPCNLCIRLPWVH